ncbi:hypothetical protein GDO81_001849 [Engystomops pustulosus]|uniref:Uncharacterized protein n=1 Tax=Engystomops pustulosus TaxID=76066 RepID=A0AAV7DFS1_ENGPU|nr:hypothetical protein GDO81_001847 [Engystomops pustulosus]KAG8596323.1 hypothetical protein GDO81_001849 [Engystomops pustulosus]
MSAVFMHQTPCSSEKSLIIDGAEKYQVREAFPALTSSSMGSEMCLCSFCAFGSSHRSANNFNYRKNILHKYPNSTNISKSRSQYRMKCTVRELLLSGETSQAQ